MKLIIFPGLGDPFHKSYEEVYNVIIEEAKKRKISDVRVVNYPGHSSYNKDRNIKTAISFDNSIEVIKNEISIAESSKSKYRILCRSYSTMLFLLFLADNKPNIKFIEKAVLWGGPVCEDKTNSFLANINKNIESGLKKGVNVDINSISAEIHAEELINKININFPIFITSGENDKILDKDCYNKLKKINNNPNIIFHKLLKNVEHAINQPNQEYFSLIFD